MTMSIRLALLALTLTFALAAAAPSPPANIYVWSADFVSPSDWYQTNITSGRVFIDARSPDATSALWTGDNGMNKIAICNNDNSTFGSFGQGHCSMGCVGGRCHHKSTVYCFCSRPCNAYALLCSLQTAHYVGWCKIGGVMGDLWTVVGTVSVCMSDGKPLGIMIWGDQVAVQFSNFKTVVPESAWELPPYCQSQCA